MIARQSSVVVGIATRNRPELLRKALASVRMQTYAPLLIRVVDDAASDDATPALRAEFPEIAWERNDLQQGYVRARNRMMLSADEDYYVSLDDDAWFVQGDEIAVAVRYLDEYQKAAAVAFDILSPDRPDPVRRAAPRPAAMVIGCGHMLRLSAVKAVGGYDESPGSYGAEEKELCLRLIDAGYEIVKLDGVHVWHDKTPQARDWPRQVRSGVCNDLTVALRRVPLAALAPMLMWKLVSHTIFAARHAMLRPCLQGMADFIGAAGATWRGRGPVRLATLLRFRRLSKAG